MSRPHVDDPGTADASTGELISRLSTQTSELVRGEIRLAQAEIARKVKFAGFGAGALGAAGLVALFGTGALVATAIIALALVLPTWLAALVVTLVLYVVAAGLALFGKREVQQATPPVPERAVAGAKEDIRTVQEARHRDR